MPEFTACDIRRRVFLWKEGSINWLQMSKILDYRNADSDSKPLALRSQRLWQSIDDISPISQRVLTQGRIDLLFVGNLDRRRFLQIESLHQLFSLLCR